MCNIERTRTLINRKLSVDRTLSWALYICTKNGYIKYLVLLTYPKQLFFFFCCEVCIMWFKVWSCDLFWGVWFVEGHVSNTKMDIVPSYTVGANKRFTFLFHSIVVLQCEYSWKKPCEIVTTLVTCTPFLRVLSIVKVLNAYARCTCIV